MPINDRARQYFDYQLRDVPSYDNPYDSYLEKRKKLEQELDKLGVQDDLERDRIAAEYLGRAPSTEAGYGTRFLDALASGGDQFQMNIGAMGEALGDKIGMAPLEIAGRNLAERNRQEMSYAPKFADTPEEQSQKGFLRNLDDLSLQAVESLVGSSPAMLPPLAGAAIGGPLGAGVGIGGGLFGNAALEGGSTFSDYRNELIQRGYSERDAERLARKARDEVFSENLTDAELLTYGVAQGLVGPMAKGLGVLGTGAIQAGTGGLQEGRQYEVTETATGNPMEQFTGRFSTPEGRNAMAVGAIAEMPMVAAEYGAAKYQQRFDPRVDADATAVIQEAKGRAQQSVNESEAIRKQQILEREQFLKEQRAAENERRKAEKERLKQIQQQRIDEEKLRQEQIKTDKARLQALKDLSDDGQTDTKLPDDGSADFVEPITADQIMLQEYEARQQAEREATQEPTPEPAPEPAPVEPEVVAEPEPTPEPTPEPAPTFSDELDQLDQLEEEQQQQQPEPEPAVEEQVDSAELEAAAAAKEQEIRQRIIDEIKSRAELGDKQPKGLRIGSANRLQNPVRVLQQIAGDEVVETQLSFEQLRLLDQTLSSERRKGVVNEAIKEVLQRQPASSTDISQGVDLREPEIQESTMTPPAPAPPAPAPMEQEQEAVQDQTETVVEDTTPLPENLPETPQPTPADELKSDLLRKKEAATQAYEEMDESLFGTKEEDKLDAAMEKADRAYQRGLTKAQKEWDKLSATTGKKGTLAPNQLQNAERRTKKLFEDAGLRRSQADPLVYTQKLIEFGKDEMANTAPGEADVVQGRKREEMEDDFAMDDDSGAGGIYSGYGNSNQYYDDTDTDLTSELRYSYSAASRKTQGPKFTEGSTGRTTVTVNGEVVQDTEIAPSTKLTARQVKAAMEGVKSVLKKLDPNGDKVTVVANKDEAVAKLREMGRKRDADDLAKRGDDVMEEGFVIPGTGQIFLVADQIEGSDLRSAVDRMVEVTFHEALGHAGLRGLMGDNFGKFIKNFGIKNEKKIDAWLKTEDGSLYSSDPRDVQVEEYIARNFAEKGVQNVGFVEGLAQDVLQSLGMRKYSETALKRAMIKVQDSYVGRDGDIVDGTRGQVEEDEELRNVETVESPLVAAFQRWFGDSKVLDKNGNPRVVYHGTGGGEIVSFDPSKRGSFTKAASAKKGFFFAGNPKTARLYFDQNKITRNRTNGYYLKMENPLVYDQKGGPRKKLYNDIIKDAIRKGHDGVIIKNTFDGRREAGRGPQDDIFVVFDNKQIKRVDNKGTFNPDDERVKYSRRQASGDEVQGEPSYDENLAAADTSEEAVTAWKDANRGKYLEDPSPELIAAAKEYSEGNYKTEAEMLAAQQKYLAAVKKYDPIKPLKTVPPIRPWSDHANALISSKLKGNKGLLGLTKFIADGVRVGLRLDIPSYKDFGVYTPTVHDKNGSPIGYGKAAKITDVTFGADNIAKKALRVAVDESPKSPFAKMNGAFVNEDPNVLYDQAVEIMNNPIGEATYRDADGNTWTQVGYKPHRHSWFYDKTDGMPVDTAEEVIQVGALVLAKNAVRGKPTDQKYLTKAFEDGGVLFSRRRRNIVGGEVPLSDWTLPTESKIKLDLIYKLQDKMVDTDQVVKAIKEARGDILDRWNPYLQEELYHGRTAKQTTDFLKKELQPLMEKLRDNNLSIAEFDEFLQNRHAQERNEQIAKINPALPDQGSGIKTADAQAYLNNLSPEQRQTFDDLARIVDDITAETRNILRNSSLESAATIENWENTYRYYVPLQREEFDFSPVQPGGGTGQGFDVRGPSSKGAVGSKRQVVDILANVALQRERAITRAQKNRVAQAIYGLAVQNPNPDFWLVIDPKNSKNPQLVAAQLQQMGIDPNVVENIAQKPLTSVRDKKTGLVHQRVNDALQNSDNYYSVRINGENKFVIFNANNPTSQRMVASIKNLDGQQLSEGMSHAAQITRYFASVNTQYNPIFGVVNLVRDTGGAAFNLSSTPLAGQQKAVTAGLFPALSGIYANLRGNNVGRNEYSNLYEEFQKEGGQTGYRDMFIRSNERAIALQKMLDPAGWADSKMGRFFTANGLLKAPMENVRQAGNKYLFDWLSDYNETMENAIRLSAYKVAKDQGMSNEQAASLAKNLTVNFNRKGQIATQAGALYAFFNATMQGNKRLVETLKGPAGKKIFAGGILLGVMQAALLEAVGYDEEEPPYFVRERNLIIPTGEKDYIQIPMPLGLHLLPNFGRVLTEYSIATAKSGKFQNPSKQIFELTGSFLDAFVPIGNAGFSTQTIVPTMGDPLAAIIENKDWSGRPIAQKDMSSTNPTPGYTRAKDTATWINTQIAKFLNYASGGTEFKKGEISPTPDQLDYLVGQAFGGVGRELLKGEQYIRSKFTGEELPPYKIPLGGRFYGNVGSSAAISNQFFTNITRMNEHQAEIEGLIKSGRAKEAQQYIRDNPEARLYNNAGKFENSVRKLRKQRREMKERDLPRQQIETIENLIRSQMEALNNMVRKYK